MNQRKMETDKEAKIPNARTRAAMAEAEELILARRNRLGIAQGYKTVRKSRKTLTTKRTALPRNIEKTKSFYKDWNRLSDSEKHDMTRLKEGISIQEIDKQLDFGAGLERAAMDNPDMPPGFIYDILISKSQSRAFAEPFIPE